MNRNSVNQILVTEEDFIEVLYANAAPSRITISPDDERWVLSFNRASAEFGIPTKIDWGPEWIGTHDDFIEHNLSNWHLPEEYARFDPYKYCIGKCETEAQRERVRLEQQLFEERNMTHVLQFLKHFVDTLREHDIVWGVGRGSSVASYMLFLLGVHRVDSLQYDLDIKEFLK